MIWSNDHWNVRTTPWLYHYLDPLAVLHVDNWLGMSAILLSFVWLEMKVITKFEEDTKSQGKSNFRKRYLSQHFVLGRYISLVRSIPYHSSNLLCNFSRFHSAHNRGGWVNSFHQKESVWLKTIQEERLAIKVLFSHELLFRFHSHILHAWFEKIPSHWKWCACPGLYWSNFVNIVYI